MLLNHECCSIYAAYFPGYFLTFIGHSPAFRCFKSAGLTSKEAQYQSLGPCQTYSGWIYF